MSQLGDGYRSFVAFSADLLYGIMTSTILYAGVGVCLKPLSLPLVWISLRAPVVRVSF